jgi:hypothetical protein
MPYVKLSSMEFTTDRDSWHTDDWIKNDLKGYDDKLDAKWNNKEHLWWIIRETPKHQWVMLFKAKELDNRILEKLYEADVWRHGARNYEDMIQSYNDKVDRDLKRYQREEAMEIAERAWVERVREHKNFFSMTGR